MGNRFDRFAPEAPPSSSLSDAFRSTVPREDAIKKSIIVFFGRIPKMCPCPKIDSKKWNIDFSFIANEGEILGSRETSIGGLITLICRVKVIPPNRQLPAALIWYHNDSGIRFVDTGGSEKLDCLKVRFIKVSFKNHDLDLDQIRSDLEKSWSESIFDHKLDQNFKLKKLYNFRSQKESVHKRRISHFRDYRNYRCQTGGRGLVPMRSHAGHVGRKIVDDVGGRHRR